MDHGDSEGAPRVAIIDDHGVFRAALQQALEHDGGFKVVPYGVVTAVGANGSTAIDVMVTSELEGRWSSIVATTSAGGAAGAHVLIIDAPDPKVLAVARDLGIAACVPRTAWPSAFIKAVNHAAHVARSRGADVGTSQKANGSVRSAEGMSEGAPREGDPRIAPEEASVPSLLSARDIQVLAAVGRGLSNREIGHKLRLSDQTVKNRLTAILRMVGATDRTEAVVIAIRRGWLRLDAISGDHPEGVSDVDVAGETLIDPVGANVGGEVGSPVST